MNSAYFLLLGISLYAQETRFEVRSRVVVVPVTVKDANGKVVDGLEAADFRVLDRGVPQRVTVDTIATGVAPIALAIVVQSSGISYAALEKVRKIGGMIRPLILGERGCASLFSFAETVRRLQDCTNDTGKLEEGLRQVRIGQPKQAAMLDAVYAATEELGKQPTARRILLLISEGKDRGSETELEVAVAAAQNAGVTVYAATYSAFRTAFATKTSSGLVGLQDSSETPRKQYPTVDGAPPPLFDPGLRSPQNSVDFKAVIGELNRLHKADTTRILADATGGEKLSFLLQKGLERALEELGADLHTQYLLSFYPTDPTPGYHRLKVTITRAGVFPTRARPGYWTSEASKTERRRP